MDPHMHDGMGCVVLVGFILLLLIGLAAGFGLAHLLTVTGG